MKIKICGLFRPKDIEYVNQAMPDYIGFVFARSRRQVTPDQAKVLKEMLNPRIQAVGVFVDTPIEVPARLLKDGIIDLVQLHGGEGADYISRLQAEAGHPVIKAIRVENAEDINAAQRSPADFLLLDHGTGGTGKSFDWSLMREPGMTEQGDMRSRKRSKPFFLAGGIHPGNVDEAMKAGTLASLASQANIIRPYAIDVSSGAETDGVKDKDKILELVRRVRNV